MSTASPLDKTANITMTIAASAAGHTYQVQRSPNLEDGTWENVGPAQSGTGGQIQILIPVNLTGQKGFSRILINR